VIGDDHRNSFHMEDLPDDSMNMSSSSSYDSQQNTNSSNEDEDADAEGNEEGPLMTNNNLELDESHNGTGVAHIISPLKNHAKNNSVVPSDLIDIESQRITPVNARDFNTKPS